MKKPDGQTLLTSDRNEIMKFMGELPVRKVPYIGRMTELTLNAFGIENCKDAIEKAADIYLGFKPANREFLLRSFMGLGNLVHEEEYGV